jgi:hypothetical protein
MHVRADAHELKAGIGAGFQMIELCDTRNAEHPDLRTRDGAARRLDIIGVALGRLSMRFRCIDTDAVTDFDQRQSDAIERARQ